MRDADRDPFLASYDALHRLARDILGDEHEAHDVVQDVWLEMGAARGVRDWAPWLRAVTRHVALRAKSRGARRGQIHEASNPPDAELAADERAGRAELCGLLERLVADLGEPYRTVVRSRYLEERGYEEIARAAGTTPSTVRSQLRRGLARLRDTLDRHHGGERAVWTAVFLRTFGPEPSDGAAPTAATGRTARAALRDPRAWASAALVGLVAVVAVGWLAAREPSERTLDVATRTERASPAAPERASADPVRSPLGALAATEEPPGPEPARDVPGIRLRVVDELGRPVEAAHVHLGRSRGGAEPVGTTDVEGRFEVEEPQPDVAAEGPDRHHGNYAVGEAYLTVEKGGMQSSPLHYFDWESAAGQALEVRLVHGDFRLVGRIVDAEGAGIGGVQVGLNRGAQVAPRVERAFRIMPYSTATSTAPDGSFEIRGLSPDPQLLSADHPEYVLAQQNLPAEAWSTGGEVEVVLERGVVLRGTVQDGSQVPVDGALVRLWRWTEGAPRTATTGPDGRFELAGLPRETVRLFASSATGPTGRATASTAVDLRAGEPATWTATLVPSGDVEFELVDPSGAPLDGWRVQLATAERNWFAAVTTGPDGVSAPLADWPREPLDLHVFRAGPDEKFPAHVVHGWTPSPGRERCVVDAVGSVPGAIHASVRQASGDPFPAVHVYLSSLASGMITRPELDPGTGAFAVDQLPPGDYLVIANTPSGKADLARVSLLAGETRDLGILRAPAAGWLTVELDPPADGEMASYLLYADWPHREGVKPQAMIGGAGVPTRRELLAGPYEVEVTIGARVERRRIELKAGEETVVRLDSPSSDR